MTMTVSMVMLLGVNKSPAQLVTGRQLRDGVQIDRQFYKLQRRQAFCERETDMAGRHADIIEQQGTPGAFPH